MLEDDDDGRNGVVTPLLGVPLLGGRGREGSWSGGGGQEGTVCNGHRCRPLSRSLGLDSRGRKYE